MEAEKNIESIVHVIGEDMTYVHKKFGRLRKAINTSKDQEDIQSAPNVESKKDFSDIAAYSSDDEVEEPKAKRECNYLPFRPWEIKSKIINELATLPTPPSTPPQAELLPKPAAGKIKEAYSNYCMKLKSTPMQTNLNMSMPSIQHLPYSPAYAQATSMMLETGVPTTVNLVPSYSWHRTVPNAQLSNPPVLPTFPAHQLTIAPIAAPNLCPPQQSVIPFVPCIIHATARAINNKAKKRARKSGSTQATREILKIVVGNNPAILEELIPYRPNMARKFPAKPRTPEQQLRRERNTIACRISRRKKMLKKVLEQEIFPAIGLGTSNNGINSYANEKY